jgi:hypothetical protein
MLNVVCVLKAGRFEQAIYKDGYTPDDVLRLRNMVADNLTIPHRFICFSDVDVPCERIPLKNNWPGWWSKVEIFSEVFDDTVIYIDLDTVIAGDISHFADYNHRFTMLRDFGSWNVPNSGLMAWKGDYSFLYKTFTEGVDKYMIEYNKAPRLGDQSFISERQKPYDFWQEVFPDQVFSYKKHIMGKPKPADVRVVCFHGEPKGSGSGGWVKEIWSKANGRG